MSNRVEPLSHVNALQATATNPKASIWVSANAGSGKTYVLSRRVIRLLLAGSKPSELLCLTFTKAAAAEMSNRVFKILSEWAMMNDADLAAAIDDLMGGKTAGELKARYISRARVLFALALDTPGGLRIQTIHAFCESLLHQFPLEANVPGHFEMMDDITQTQMLEEARRFVVLAGLGLNQTGSPENSPIAPHDINDAFEVIREHASDAAIEKAINQLVKEREDFSNWIDENGGDVQRAMTPLWKRFQFSPQDSLRQLREEVANLTVYSPEKLNNVLDMLHKKDSSNSEKLLEQFSDLASAKTAKEKIEIKLQIFFTRGKPKKGFVSRNFMDDNQLWNDYLQEQHLIHDQIDRINTLESLKTSEALFLIAEAILIEYDNLKKRRGVLDFGDLIARTANLLSRNEISAWVHYKLDSGISHLLVDEAQDTSPLQWKIIETITSEFYAGKGARDQIRTVFVVGDEKQSIFSFQGADPKEFAKQFSLLKQKSENARLEFSRVQLTTSFRSTPEVLSAVDQVFSLPENAAGLGFDTAQQVHQANRRSDRGEVLVWPLEIKHKKPEKTHWRKPPEEPTPDDAEVRLAEKIADTIHGWIKSEACLPGRNEPIRYGDILILVRKRDRFVAAINRALKTKGLAAAGADRLKLTEHIAVEDMLALGRFAMMTMDDLSLASILKSPIFDLTEEELFAVSHGRGKSLLFDHLVMMSEGNIEADIEAPLNSKLKHCVKILMEIQTSAQTMPVYAFYGRLFSRYQLRQKYLNRLGYEVAEILDGFFQAAMNYDNQTGLGLQGFVQGLADSKLELKREIDMERNEIRVITAHSSKGLEAPIVFLVDPGSKAFNTSHAPAIIKLVDENGQTSYLWQSESKKRIAASAGVFDAMEKAAEEEYRRLLYVGMTRAADRLIICGYQADREINYDHWYTMVEKGLSAPIIDKAFNGRFENPDGGDNPTLIRQWLIENRDHRDVKQQEAETALLGQLEEIPSWCSALPIEPPAPHPLSPSGVLQLLDIAPDTGVTFSGESSLALDRGNAVHDLMQILPDIAEEKHDEVFSNYFMLSDAGLEPIMIDEIIKMVQAILQAPEAEILFGADSRAEVEISGEVKLGAHKHLVRGKIDRLAILPERIVIADYKTNRHVPLSADAISPEYLAQMALYRELVSKIYPDKPIDCLIIWSENGAFMPISAALLDNQVRLLNKS